MLLARNALALLTVSDAWICRYFATPRHLPAHIALRAIQHSQLLAVSLEFHRWICILKICTSCTRLKRLLARNALASLTCLMRLESRVGAFVSRRYLTAHIALRAIQHSQHCMCQHSAFNRMSRFPLALHHCLEAAHGNIVPDSVQTSSHSFVLLCLSSCVLTCAFRSHMPIATGICTTWRILSHWDNLSACPTYMVGMNAS